MGLGNASTQSAGLCECLGWPAKSVSVGNAARNGLFSALLAEKGFSGPAEPIAGAQGFLAAMGEPPNWAALTEGLGETWEVSNNSLKPYPCGLRDPSPARLRARLAAPASRRRRRAGRRARQSPAAAAHRPARGRDRPRSRRSACSMRWPRRWCWARQDSISSPTPASTTPLSSAMRAQDRGGGRSRDLDHRHRDRFLDVGRQEAQRLDPGGARHSANPLKDAEIEREASGRGEELAARPRHAAADRCGVGARQERRRVDLGRDDRAATSVLRAPRASGPLRCQSRR